VLLAALVLACVSSKPGISMAQARGSNSTQGSNGAQNHVTALQSASQGTPNGMTELGGSTLTRVRIQVKGLVSPRAAQNIFIRLDKQQGVRAFKCDLGANVITVDFKPDEPISEADAVRVIRSAGWTPGWIKIEKIPFSKAVADEAGEYWYVLPHLDGESSFKRWLVINFVLWNRYKNLSPE
jgi:hypothetical protein